MKYYIIAGEASGDLHGSNLMKGLFKIDPECDIRFWGGDKMASVGGTIVKHYRSTAVMGFVEVLKKGKQLLSNISFCKKEIIAYSPDAIILIDYAGFNLRIARFAKEKGIKVYYYIAPKVWAWNEGRIKQLKKYVDKLYIIFPFEVEYFKKQGIEPLYFGNPLMESIKNHPCWDESREAFLKRYSLDNKPIIALLAGSRKGEIGWLLPRYIPVAKHFSDKFNIVVAGAPSIDEKYYNSWLQGSNIKLIKDDTYSLLKNAQGAIVASGTASLEAALIGTPQVVCYGGNRLSVAIARKLIKLKYISLANLILNREIFKELIQEECSTEGLIIEMNKLLYDSYYRDVMERDYKELKNALGWSSENSPSENIAKSMIAELKRR